MFEAQPFRGLERRVTTPSPVFAILSVLVVAAIAFASLCPIGLRPHLASANQERIGAYFLLGFLFAMSFRRHWKLVEIDPLPTPFCGIVNSKMSSKVVDVEKPSKKMAVIEGVKGVPLVKKKCEPPTGKMVAALAAGALAKATAPMAQASPTLFNINLVIQPPAGETCPPHRDRPPCAMA